MKFWNWTESELTIDGPIAEESWWGDEVTPKMFKDELNQHQGPITMWLNSPGGDCFAASQIYSMIRDYPGHVTIKINGLAASAASVIAMAGDRVEMEYTAMMMIHNPSTIAFGDHNEMAHAIKVLKEVKESIVNAYVKKTGLDRDEISNLMEKETWMNAIRAKDLGFIDDFIGDKEKLTDSVEISTSYNKTGMQNLLNKLTAPKMEHEIDNQPVSEGRSIRMAKLSLKKL